MSKGVVIVAVVGLLVTAGVAGLLPLLGTGSDGCCGPSGAAKPTSTGVPTLGGCCAPLAQSAQESAGLGEGQAGGASDKTTVKLDGLCCGLCCEAKGQESYS